MSYVDLVDDTICALITTPGLSGISVIRVSGTGAFDIVKKFCAFLPEEPESHRVYFGRFRSSGQEIIDECLLTYFAKGRSFTGDETLEISVHGGFSCSDRVLSELLSAGCRAAERGEFSFRSFYNGNIDLVQAEAIHSIIHSRSDLARSQALKQLTGSLSKSVDEIERDLIHVLAQLEASIDFSTEDIEPYSLNKTKQLTEDILSRVNRLAEGFKKGRVINEGLNIVIAGAPNAGKSSLYNSLLGRDKAIVSATPGTTRDVLESSYREFGLPLWLIDTAGLRETEEEVEKLGILRTKEKVELADYIFFVLDGTQVDTWDLEPIKSRLLKTVFIVTKIDQLNSQNRNKADFSKEISQKLGSHKPTEVFLVSSVTLEGIQELKGFIEQKSLVDIHQDESLITQHRHFDHLSKCSKYLSGAVELFDKNASYDLLALEIQSGLREIFGLLGKEFDEQVLDHVFKQFCIGK
jgi:tRNA modification GTPase